ncbi:MAG: hypothetical protein QW756_00230 [Nitrososphaerota archaeon]
MGELAQRLYKSLTRIRDPTSGAPAFPLTIDVAIEELGGGDVILTITPRDPYTPTALSYAEAVKAIASRVEGVKRVTIICRNHVMADLINMRLNQKP